MKTMGVQGRRNRGASAISYALLIGLVGVGAISAVDSVGDGVSDLFGSVSSRIESLGGGRTGDGKDPDTPGPDTPSEVSLSLEASGAAEGMELMMTLSHPAATQAGTVALVVSGAGAAGDAADFAPTPGDGWIFEAGPVATRTLDIAIGSNGQQVTLPIAADGLTEGAETITVRLQSPSAGFALATTDGINVTLSDVVPTASVGISDTIEGEDHTISIMLSEPSLIAGTVTATVTALDAADYAPGLGWTNAGGGTWTQEVVVAIGDQTIERPFTSATDSQAEGGESLTVALSAANWAISGGAASATTLDRLVTAQTGTVQGAAGTPTYTGQQGLMNYGFSASDGSRETNPDGLSGSWDVFQLTTRETSADGDTFQQFNNRISQPSKRSSGGGFDGYVGYHKYNGGYGTVYVAPDDSSVYVDINIINGGQHSTIGPDGRRYSYTTGGRRQLSVAAGSDGDVFVYNGGTADAYAGSTLTETNPGVMVVVAPNGDVTLSYGARPDSASGADVLGDSLIVLEGLTDGTGDANGQRRVRTFSAGTVTNTDTIPQVDAIAVFTLTTANGDIVAVRRHLTDAEGLEGRDELHLNGSAVTDVPSGDGFPAAFGPGGRYRVVSFDGTELVISDAG